MKPAHMILLATVALLIVPLIAKSGGAGVPSGNLGLSQLTNDPDSLGRLNAIYTELLRRGYSTQQILFMLSQILHESGLLTSIGNYGLMNANNYAGLTNVGGGYAFYPSISAFVDAYDGFLSKGADPLGAVSLYDFNNRLVANHYYTDNSASYYNDLVNYYNLLTQTLQ